MTHVERAALVYTEEEYSAALNNLIEQRDQVIEERDNGCRQVSLLQARLTELEQGMVGERDAAELWRKEVHQRVVIVERENAELARKLLVESTKAVAYHDLVIKLLSKVPG